jgi:hypothetical protein
MDLPRKRLDPDPRDSVKTRQYPCKRQRSSTAKRAAPSRILAEVPRVTQAQGRIPDPVVELGHQSLINEFQILDNLASPSVNGFNPSSRLVQHLENALLFVDHCLEIEGHASAQSLLIQSKHAFAANLVGIEAKGSDFRSDDV